LSKYPLTHLWGLSGGNEGSKNYTKILFADGREPEIFGKTAQYHLKKDDVARLVTGTGGGYGQPFERPVEQIREDVRNGYISLKQAEQDYGVVLEPDTLAVEKLAGERLTGS
jgi:N-methylhydantoinase B